MFLLLSKKGPISTLNNSGYIMVFSNRIKSSFANIKCIVFMIVSFNLILAEMVYGSHKMDEDATTLKIQNRATTISEVLEFAFVLLSSNCDSHIANLAKLMTDAVSSSLIVNTTIRYHDM